MLVRILAGLAIALVAVVAALAITAHFMSADAVRAVMASQVRQFTGKELVVNGDAHVALLPDLRVELEDVRVLDPADEDETELEMRALSGSLALWPLLSGRIEIDGFTLDAPRLVLRVDEAGRPNWRLARDGQADGGADDDGGGGTSLPIREVDLGEIVVRDGHIVYSDARLGRTEEIEDIDVTLDGADLAAALRVHGGLSWRGERVETRLSVERPGALAGAGESPFNLSVKAPALEVSLNGHARAEGLSGAFDARSSSMRALVTWLGTPMQEGATLGPARLSGSLSLDRESASLAEAALELDANRAEGALGIAYGRDVPLVQATLDSERLDVGPYLGEADGAGAAGESIDAEQAATRLPEGFEADIRLSAREILAGERRLEQVAATFGLREGAFVARLDNARLYGGTATGALDLAPAGEGVRLAVQGRLSEIAVESLLEETLGLSRLTGRADAVLELSGTGSDLAAARRALEGEVTLNAEDGTIEGIALEDVIAAFAQGSIAEALGGGDQTVYDTAGGRWRLEDGVLSSEGMTLDGPNVRVDLAGDIDLVSDALSLRGRAGLVRAGELTRQLPFIITGTRSRPRILPDPRGLLDDPDAVEDLAESLREGDGSGSLRSLIDTFTRPPEADSPGAAENAPPSDAAAEPETGPMQDTEPTPRIDPRFAPDSPAQDPSQAAPENEPGPQVAPQGETAPDAAPEEPADEAGEERAPAGGDAPQP